MRGQAGGQQDQPDSECARDGLVLHGEHGGSGNGGAQRDRRGNPPRGDEAEPQPQGDQQHARGTQRAKHKLLGGEHGFQIETSGAGEKLSRPVVDGVGRARVGHHDVAREQRGILRALDGGDVDEGVGLKISVARKQEITQQGNHGHGGRHRQAASDRSAQRAHRNMRRGQSAGRMAV